MADGSITGRPVLGQLLSVMGDSERVVIYDGEDGKGGELYRGFVACIGYAGNCIDRGRRVARAGLGADFFMREKEEHKPFCLPDRLGAKVAEGNIGQFRYQDIKTVIYTEIFLEKEGEKRWK